MPQPLPDDVRAAMTAGRKIDAIRLLREQTGLGLAEAKAAVEAGEVPDAPAASSAPPEFAGLPPAAAAALAAGSKVRAIKLLREARGIGLRDAKLIVDRASRAAKQRAKLEVGGLSPVNAPRSGFSVGSIILIAIIVAALAWFYAGAN